jgi:hypothetical protein
MLVRHQLIAAGDDVDPDNSLRPFAVVLSWRIQSSG